MSPLGGEEGAKPPPTEAGLAAAGDRVAGTLQAAGEREAAVVGRLDARAAALAIEDASILRTKGQRVINSRWEWTQTIIAVVVAIETVTVCSYLIIQGRSTDLAFQLLSNAFFFVIGTYFQRTNHVKTGGVGKDETGR